MRQPLAPSNTLGRAARDGLSGRPVLIYCPPMKRFLLVLILLLIVGAGIAKLVVFELPSVSGDDMAPSLQKGDLLLANRFKTSPARGEIVLFEHPEGRGLLVRRVVGLPGEKVSVVGEVPRVDGKAATREAVREVYVSDDDAASEPRKIPMRLVEERVGDARYLVLKDPKRRSVDAKEVALEGAYYVLSDNRNHGADSRNFGPVAASRIRAVITHRLSAGPGSIDGDPPRPGFAKIE
jgi:signal peptidase I